MFATEITAQLYRKIYQSGDLMTLQAFITHIFLMGNTFFTTYLAGGKALSKDSGFAYMQMELTKNSEKNYRKSKIDRLIKC